MSGWGSYTESPQARAKRLARVKAYKLAHPELVREQARASYLRHEETRRLYREAHREELAAYFRAYNEAHRDKKREQGKAREARYRTSPAGQATVARAKAKPDYNFKQTARRAVSRAKAKGLLIPQPCQKCGDSKVQAHHHNGYVNRLDVVWLCVLHHAQVHRGTLA